MRKSGFTIILILFLICTSVSDLFADTVFLDELKKASEDSSIVFRNYSGPHSKINTVEEIRGIGVFLGKKVKREFGRFSYFEKYRVIHAVDYNTTEKLDADIFIIHKTAGVDHIVNLRRMLSGFLESAYGYSIEQADMLAEFITVYNAVHRNDMDYFSSAYKDIVLEYLTEEKAGLALDYSDWPGKTMMVIPLTPQAGEDVIADLDTDVLSDEDVISQMKSEDGQGIEERREMVELKDDEVLEEREAIEEERAEITEKKKDLSEKKEELEKQEEKESAKSSDEIKKEIDEIEEEQKELEKEEQKLDEREKRVEEREELIVEERKDIAEDQKKEIAKEEKKSSTDAVESDDKKSDSVPFVKISGEAGIYIGRLVKVDSETAEIITESEIDTIRLRGYKYSGDEIISVAGDSGGNRIVSLVKIDPDSLEIIKSATDEVYIDSAVVLSGDKYYAVVKDSGLWKIGIFSEELVLESVSEEDVFPATDIVVGKEGVIVQKINGNINLIDFDAFLPIKVE